MHALCPPYGLSNYLANTPRFTRFRNENLMGCQNTEVKRDASRLSIANKEEINKGCEVHNSD
jgi:hypothetical protein